MIRLLSGRLIRRAMVHVRMLIVQLGRLAIGPELHVTMVIARAANQARARRGATAARHSSSWTER